MEAWKATLLLNLGMEAWKATLLLNIGMEAREATLLLNLGIEAREGTPHHFLSAQQMTSQLTVISFDHTFFRSVNTAGGKIGVVGRNNVERNVKKLSLRRY